MWWEWLVKLYIKSSLHAAANFEYTKIEENWVPHLNLNFTDEIVTCPIIH